MKYKILFMILVILLVFTIRLSVVKEKFSNIEIVFEESNSYYHDVYFYNENKLVSVNLEIDNTDKVIQLFDLLTNKSNTIKEDYDTKIIKSSKIILYEVINKTLILEVTEDFLRYNDEESFQIYNQLQNTFSNLGYINLKIKINNEYIDNIGFINISDGIELYNL